MTLVDTLRADAPMLLVLFPLIGAAIIYLVFLLPLVRLVAVLEQRFRRAKTR